MSDGAYFVDVDGLGAGGVHLKELQQLAAKMKVSAQQIQALGATAFGEPDDVIGAPAFRTINPSQQSAVGVLADLTALIGGHAQNIGDALKITTETNTESAGRAGRRA